MQRNFDKDFFLRAPHDQYIRPLAQSLREKIIKFMEEKSSLCSNVHESNLWTVSEEEVNRSKGQSAHLGQEAVPAVAHILHAHVAFTCFESVMTSPITLSFEFPCNCLDIRGTISFILL